MKGKKKKFLGLLGLFLVAATTTFAALIPLPQADAATKVTDNVSVRVVGDKPLVKFTSPESGLVTREPNQTLSFDYENVTDVIIKIEYTDINGNKHTYTLDSFDADYNPGTKSYQVNLDDTSRYGHGDYVVRVHGSGYGADNVAEDTIEFTYTEHIGGASQDPETGKVIIDPGVDPDDERIDHVEANVYDEDGNLVEDLSPVEFKEPFDPKELDFSEHNLPSGWYTVEITEYDVDGNQVSKPRYFTFWYEAPEIPVPNTGSFFADLNISRTDYLVTGLIVFILAAGLGLFFVIRGRKEKAKAVRKKRH